MRVTVTVRDDVATNLATVIVDVSDSAQIGHIHPALVNLMAADTSGADAALAVDGVIARPEQSISESGLRDGSWVSLLPPGGVPHPVSRPHATLAQIRTVSGVDAGQTLHVGAGTVKVSSGPYERAGVTLAPESVDFIVLDDGTVHVQAEPGAAPSTVTVDGVPLVGRVTLATGAQLTLPDRVLEVGRHLEQTGSVERDPTSGAHRYNRPPRFLPPAPQSSFRLPPEPTEPPRQKIPVLVALLPLLFSAVLAIATSNYRMLAFGLMSPVLMIANVVNGRRQGAARYRQQVADHAAMSERIEHDAHAAVDLERQRELFLHPDPAMVGLIATGPTPRLWERRIGDEHFLALRCGTAAQPSHVVLEDPSRLEHERAVTRELRDAPAVVSLSQAGTIGIAGAGSTGRQLTQWLLAQVGVLHSPRDVQVYVLVAPRTAQPTRPDHDWGFATWLPHTRPWLGQACVRTLGVGAQSLATRIAELLAVIEQRKQAAREQSGTTSHRPVLVVVMDGAQRLRSMPGVTQILTEGPAFGVLSLCVDSDERLLPEECDTVVTVGGGELTIHRHREASLAGIRPDWVGEDWLDWTARAIAPIEDASPDAGATAVPDSSRLLDVLGLEPPTAGQIAARWTLNPRSTVAVVGESLDGAFRIDLAQDGPHALVAGTTGSGKSELLQTLVASLAVANSPEGMTFVLVDYKGGAAFKDCEHLPHTVGMVTDLDQHLVERALASLGAELRHREHVLAAAGAKDLEDYLDLVGRGRAADPMPRLAIVIDEFASLARELPAFVAGLVNIAQRGRSLGIHLVLATQRPSGVVSAEIRANTNLRIALRVTDAAESVDVIDASEAAQISKTTPGRAYVRLGSSSLIPFQAGRVGGRRQTATSDDGPVSLIQPLDLTDLAGPPPEPARPARSAGAASEDTDLTVLVAAIQEAAGALRIPAPRRPWLPALPPALSLAEVLADRHRQTPADGPANVPVHGPASARSDATPARRGTQVVFGREDRAAEQRQPAAFLDFEADTAHLSIIGAARSGRTTALRTIAASIALTYPVDQAHVFVLDCGNGALLPLRDLANVGAVVLRNQNSEAARLIGKLRTELQQRQQQLATEGHADLGEHRSATPAGERLPRLILLLDSWEGFVAAFGEADGGALVESIQVLLREGSSAGIHLILTGDRQLVTGRMGSLVQDKLALRLIEHTDYAAIGLQPRSIPDDLPPGRCFWAGSGTEVQIAVLGTDPSGPGQRTQIAALATGLAERAAAIPEGRRPFGVEVMPATLPYADLARRCDLTSAGIPLGLGGSDVHPLLVDLTAGSAGFVIAGPGGSGRSTALLTVVRGAIERGIDVVVVAPRRSPLRDIHGPHVKAVFTATDITREELEPLLVTEATTGPDGSRSALRCLLAVDDADLLRDASADSWLRTLIPRASDHGLGIVVAGETSSLGKGFSGWLIELRKCRQGLLLRADSLVDGDVIGGRLRRSDLDLELPTGRGFAQLGTAATQLVQVAISPAMGVPATEETA